jgi:hypothetical protein
MTSIDHPQFPVRLGSQPITHMPTTFSSFGICKPDTLDSPRSTLLAHLFKDEP